MSDKLKSIFGAYSEKLQVVVDNSLDRFAPTWHTKYFDMGTPTTSLTFVTAIGASRVEAAASIVDRDGRTPLRSRGILSKLNGEVPAIKEMFKMSETDYRNFLTFQQMATTDEAKKKQILDLMFNDTKKVGDSVNKKLDLMVIEAISTGQITVTTTNNPDGIVAPTAIDLLMPAGNKKTAAVDWATAATATPITDINAVVTDGRTKGKVFAKMLMTRSRFIKMAATAEVRSMVAGMLRMAAKELVQPTIAQVNEYLSANLLPVVEIVDEYIGVEKDGAISTINPFSEDNVSFIPAGKLGIIHNAMPIEKFRPVSGVAYADYNSALISKWSQNEPFGEFTKVEGNMFPGLETIDSIFLLDTTP